MRPDKLGPGLCSGQRIILHYSWSKQVCSMVSGVPGFRGVCGGAEISSTGVVALGSAVPRGLVPLNRCTSYQLCPGLGPPRLLGVSQEPRAWGRAAAGDREAPACGPTAPQTRPQASPILAT